MNSFISRFIFCAAVSFAAPTTNLKAQILGGDFETPSARASWQWGTGIFDFASQRCNTTAITSAQIEKRSYAIQTPHGGASGYIANIAPPVFPTQELSRRACFELKKRFTVAPGHFLEYSLAHYRLPNNNANPAVGSNSVEVRVIDVASGNSRVIGDFAYAEDCPYLSRACNYMRPRQGSLSEFWGREVELVFTVVDTSRIFDAYAAVIYPNVEVDSIRTTPLEVSMTSTPQSGSWYNPSKSGTGFNLSRTPDSRVVALWYTFTESGLPIWYMSEARHVFAGRWESPIWKVTRNPLTGATSQTLTGSLRLSLYSATSGTMEWTLASRSGSEPVRFLAGGGALSGMWYNPATSGNGFSVDQVAGGSEATAVSVFFFNNGEPVWANGVASGSPSSSRTVYLTSYQALGLCPGCSGPISIGSQPAGSITLTLAGWSGTGFASVYDGRGGQYVFGSASTPVSLARLTAP